MEALIDRTQDENTPPQKDTTPALQPETSTAKGVSDVDPAKKMEPKRIRAYESQYDRWQ